jgi:hypothetical protein
MRIESRRQEDGKPAMKRRRRRSAWPIAVVIAIGVGGCVPSFVKSVEEDHGTYYRLKVKLAYKGEQQDFDIVVGCNVRRIYYNGNGSTYEAGLVPTLFGRRMGDGKGLVVRPPNACDGETTANGQVQPDLLPIVVVYENADVLDFGTAYLSEDAYENPLSALKFGGATIEKATRADFDEFRRAQPNLVKRESFFKGVGGDALLEEMKLPPVATPLASVCETYERYLVPDQQRALLRQHWPEGRPHYWLAASFDEQRVLIEAIVPRDHTGGHAVRSDRRSDIPHSVVAFGSPTEHEANYGMPTRSGGGLVATTRGNRFPPAYYPAASGYRVDQWPLDRTTWNEYIAAHDAFADVVIDFRGGRAKGFGYCFRRVGPDVPREKRRFGRVDREDVFAKSGATPVHPGSNVDVPTWIFEGDEYLLRYMQIPLGSTRGDV